MKKNFFSKCYQCPGSGQFVFVGSPAIDCWARCLQPLCLNSLRYFHPFVELQDPFAKIVVDGSGQCHSTEVVKSTLDPKWNQHYDL